MNQAVPKGRRKSPFFGLNSIWIYLFLPLLLIPVFEFLHFPSLAKGDRWQVLILVWQTAGGAPPAKYKPLLRTREVT